MARNTTKTQLSNTSPNDQAVRGGSQPPVSAWRVRTVVESGIVVVMGAPDTRISRLAELQHGRVARWQLLAAGLSADEIKYRIGIGVLRRVHQGVYAVGHDTPSEHSAEVAALLTCRTRTLVAGLSAAHLWGMRRYEGDVVHVVTHQRFGQRVRPGICAHRTRSMDHLAVHFIDGIPVTSPAYALLDSAPTLSPRELERALDEALSLKIVTREQVVEVVESNPTRRGVRLLRKLNAERLVSNRTDSQGQERVLALIRAARLPEPKADADIGGGFTADFYWPDARVACEFDSFKFHSGRWSWGRDHRKDNHCEHAGIALVRVTWEDLDDHPFEVVSKLARRIEAGLAVSLRGSASGALLRTG
jgi:very-short-patch-repair endonuclease